MLVHQPPVVGDSILWWALSCFFTHFPVIDELQPRCYSADLDPDELIPLFESGQAIVPAVELAA
jgi:hypothetical protein